MKTIKFTFLLTIFFLTTTKAQITKGNWMVGGTASFSYSKTENINNTPSSGTTINFNSVGTYTIQLEPNIGYFLINKFAIGCKLNYRNAFSEGEKINVDGMNLSLGPYLRYYFLKKDKVYNLFIEPSYNRFLSESLGNAYSFAMKSGLVIFMNSSVGVETTISYTKSTSSKFERNDVFFGVGLQIHLEKDK